MDFSVLTQDESPVLATVLNLLDICRKHKQILTKADSLHLQISVALLLKKLNQVDAESNSQSSHVSVVIAQLKTLLDNI